MFGELVVHALLQHSRICEPLSLVNKVNKGEIMVNPPKGLYEKDVMVNPPKRFISDKVHNSLLVEGSTGSSADLPAVAARRRRRPLLILRGIRWVKERCRRRRSGTLTTYPPDDEEVDEDDDGAGPFDVEDKEVRQRKAKQTKQPAQKRRKAEGGASN